jgi:hypothetical protein
LGEGVAVKFLIAYGSKVWVNLLEKGNPGMSVLGLHDGFVVVRYRNRVWKVIGGGPETPMIREVYRHDFTRPA